MKRFEGIEAVNELIRQSFINEYKGKPILKVITDSKIFYGLEVSRVVETKVKKIHYFNINFTTYISERITFYVSKQPKYIDAYFLKAIEYEEVLKEGAK